MVCIIQCTYYTLIINIIIKSILLCLKFLKTKITIQHFVFNTYFTEPLLRAFLFFKEKTFSLLMSVCKKSCFFLLNNVNLDCFDPRHTMINKPLLIDDALFRLTVFILFEFVIQGWFLELYEQTQNQITDQGSVCFSALI